MARFGKYTFVIYLLSALAALELIALELGRAHV